MIVNNFYLLGLILGLLVLGITGGLIIKQELWLIGAVDLAAFTWATVGYVGRRRLGYRLRAWGAITALYVLGALIIYHLGPMSGGPIWLFTFAVMTGFLMGFKVTVGALVLNALTLAALNYLVWIERLPWLGEYPVSAWRWAVLSGNFVLLNALVASGVALIFRALTHSLAKESAAVRQLEQANQLLRQEGQARQETEQALRESEERYRLAFSTSPDSININKMDGTYVDINQGFTEMTGYTREDVMGRLSSEIGIWNDLADRARLLEGLTRDGQVTNLEAFFKAKDGRLITGLMSATIIKLGGEPHILTITRDIEERRQAQEQLQASLKTWDELVRAIPAGLFIYQYEEPDRLVLLDGNPEAERLSGIMVAQWRGREFAEMWPRAKQMGLTEKFLQVAKTGRTFETDDLYYEDARLAGAFRIRVFSLPGQRLAVAFEDVSERIQAEQALRESEVKLRTIFDNSRDAIGVAQRGVHVWVNPAYVRLFGYQDQEEVLGRPVLDLIAPGCRQDISEKVRRRAQGDDVPTLYETKGLRQGGGEFDMTVAVSTYELDGMDYTMVMLRDVSERRRLEAQLRQAQKMEAVGTMAGGIAHDFNNILGAVLGFAEMAMDDAQKGCVNPADLEQIMASAQRAKELVRQLLAFSRKSEPQLKPLDLNQCIERALVILERTLAKMIRIETSLAQDLPAVLADSTQMEQVLLNLANNAQDAMPEGGRLRLETMAVELDHEYCVQHLEVRPGAYVQLAVSDTGQGMDKQTLEHIFDPFFTTKAVGKGTGLGLSSAYGIVKSHGGHILCYSEPGSGTVFRVLLPVLEEPQPSIIPRSPATPARDPQLAGRESVLVVDDEEALRGLCSRFLSDQGYTVGQASSGEEALRLFEEQGRRLDLVIMDLGMPGMGGHKALKEMLALNPRAKVIIASGYAAGVQVKDALESGASGYVAKPFRRAELLATVRQVLDAD